MLVDAVHCSTMYMLIHGFQTRDIHSIHSYNLSISDRFQSGTCHLAGRLEIVRYSRAQGGSSHSLKSSEELVAKIHGSLSRRSVWQEYTEKDPQISTINFESHVGHCWTVTVLNLTLPGSWFWVPWGMPWCISRGHDFTKTRWLHGGLALPGGDCMICMDNREGWLILHYICPCRWETWNALNNI